MPHLRCSHAPDSGRGESRPWSGIVGEEGHHRDLQRGPAALEPEEGSAILIGGR